MPQDWQAWVGAAQGNWDDKLAAFLAEAHDDDGALKAGIVTRDRLAADVAASVGAADRANSIVLMGSSIEGNNGGPGPYMTDVRTRSAKGYFNWANVLLSHRFTSVVNAGKPGDTTAGMLARFATDVIAVNPGWVLINGGPNDAGQQVPSATTIANLQAMYEMALDAGIRIIAVPPIPNGTFTTNDATQRILLTDVATWVRTAYRLDPRVIIADIGQAVVDPATNWKPLTGIYQDTTHPDVSGAYRLGYRLFKVLDTRIPREDLLVLGNGNPANLLANGAFIGSGSTVPTGWSQLGTATISYVPRTDGISGSWVQLAAADVTGVAQLTTNTSIGAAVAIGDTVEALVEWECDTVEAAPAANKQYTRLTLQCYNGSTFPTVGQAYDLYTDGSSQNSGLSGARSGVLRTPPLTIPTGTTLIQVHIAFGPGGNYRFGRAVVRKVAA